MTWWTWFSSKKGCIKAVWGCGQCCNALRCCRDQSSSGCRQILAGCNSHWKFVPILHSTGPPLKRKQFHQHLAFFDLSLSQLLDLWAPRTNSATWFREKQIFKALFRITTSQRSCHNIAEMSSRRWSFSQAINQANIAFQMKCKSFGLRSYVAWEYKIKKHAILGNFKDLA